MSYLITVLRTGRSPAKFKKIRDVKVRTWVTPPRDTRACSHINKNSSASGQQRPIYVSFITILIDITLCKMVGKASMAGIAAVLATGVAFLTLPLMPQNIFGLNSLAAPVEPLLVGEDGKDRHDKNVNETNADNPAFIPNYSRLPSAPPTQVPSKVPSSNPSNQHLFRQNYAANHQVVLPPHSASQHFSHLQSSSKLSTC
eukprot:scaffold44235_cov47-Attheya_sp.AAC.1